MICSRMRLKRMATQTFCKSKIYIPERKRESTGSSIASKAVLDLASLSILIHTVPSSIYHSEGFSVEQVATLRKQIFQSFQLSTQLGALEREATGNSGFWESQMVRWRQIPF